MNLLMLSWEYPPRVVGGLARHVHELSLAHVRSGLDVTVLTCAGDKAPEVEEHGGLRVVRAGVDNPSPPDFLTWVFQFNVNLLEKAMALRELGCRWDIIHAHDWLVAYASRALKHGLKVPLVATIHATEYGRNWGLHNDLQRYISSVEWGLCYEAWRVVCCSTYMKDELLRIFGLPSDKVSVIPNGVDSGQLSPPTEPEALEALRAFRQNYAGPDERMVFFVGRLVNEKGVHVLLEAFPKVLAYDNKVKLVIAGRGPAEEHLKAMARGLDIFDRVYFTGYIDDSTRNRLYHTADVACVPSLYEPFGISALEAMAAGVPVVASDAGGLGEIIRHGINGLKAYPGNPNSLADCILTILGNPKLQARVRENARREVSERYNWDRISRETVGVYSRVLEEYERSDWHEALEVGSNEGRDNGRWERYQATAAYV